MSTQNSTATRRFDTRKLVTMGMLSAIGIVMVALVEFPLIPAAPFLKYDPADVPILIGTLIYGPVAGLIMTVVVSFIQSFLLHGSGGIIGFVMHVVATGAMVIVVGNIYKHNSKTIPHAGLSLGAGVLTMTLVMTGMNLVLTPIFMGSDVQTVVAMLIPAIIPFNLIKAGLNSIVAFLVFRYVEKLAVK